MLKETYPSILGLLKLLTTLWSTVNLQEALQYVATPGLILTMDPFFMEHPVERATNDRSRKTITVHSLHTFHETSTVMGI